MSFGEFLESADIVANFVPVDMQTGANNGQWVNMANYGRVVAVLFKAIGTDDDDPVITLLQAQDNAGAGSKALPFTRIRQKIGATSVKAVAQMTLVTQAAANTYTPELLAENEAIVAIEIKADHLDVTNGFNHVKLSVPDVGANPDLGCSFYIMLEPRFKAAAMPSAID